MKALSILFDRHTRTALWTIALPIAMQNLITYTTNMMDTVMLGQLGEVAISGASLGNQFGTIFMVLTFGIASGTNILLSQYWGKGDSASMHSILAVMYRVTLVLDILFFICARFFPAQIMAIFSPDAEVIAAGAQYLKIVCYAYFMNGISNVVLMSLRSVGTVKISVVVYITSLFVNVFFNWALIFGHLGFPRLEIVGAAIATIIARAVEIVIVLIYTFGFEKKIRMTPRSILRYDHSFLRDYRHTVTPVICNELLWSLGNSMLLVVMGRIGREFVTANTISTVTGQFVQVFIVGVCNAAAVLIGNAIGAGKYDYAKELARALLVLAVVLGVVSGLVMFLLRPFVVSLYNIPEATRILAMQIMAVASVITFFQSLSFVGMMGILRGGGDARFVLFCDVGFLWLFSIPLGFVAGLVWHWAPPLVYFILKSDEILKIIAAVFRIWSGKWVTNLTR